MRIKKFLLVTLIGVAMLSACDNADANNVVTENTPALNESSQSVDDETNQPTQEEKKEPENVEDQNSEEIGNSADSQNNTDNNVSNDAEGEKETREDASGTPATGNIDDKEDEGKVQINVTEISEDRYVSASVNVREGPSVDDKKLGTLSKDSKVHVTGKTDDGWYRIEYNSSIGYVNGGFLINQETYDKNKAEEEAKLIQAQEQAKAEAEQQAAQQQGNVGSTDTSSFASRVVELCNEQRAAYGLGPLVEDAALDNLAGVRANEIVGKFDHTRPDGSSCFTVLDGAVSYMAAGENIASGQRTPEEVVNAWMNSEGHRANILSSDFNKIGVGYISQGVYGTSWVQIFTN